VVAGGFADERRCGRRCGGGSVTMGADGRFVVALPAFPAASMQTAAAVSAFCDALHGTALRGPQRFRTAVTVFMTT